MSKLSRKEQAHLTKQKIISSTLQLLKEKPFHELKIKDICTQANISIGNFYHYFDNKQSIIVEILDQYSEQFISHIESCLLPYSQEKILFIFLEFCRIVEQLGPELVLELFVHNIISNDNFLLSQDKVLYQEIYKCIKDLQEQDLLLIQKPEEKITNTLIIFFRGFLYEWGLCQGKYSLSDEISDELGLYLSLFIASP